MCQSNISPKGTYGTVKYPIKNVNSSYLLLWSDPGFYGKKLIDVIKQLSLEYVEFYLRSTIDSRKSEVEYEGYTYN